jgi:hypothetical protein
MKIVIKAYNDLPEGVPGAGPDVQLPAAAEMTRAAGQLGEFERGFVTVLSEMAFMNAPGFGVTPGKWIPYSACSEREVEAERRRFALNARDEADRMINIC